MMSETDGVEALRLIRAEGLAEHYSEVVTEVKAMLSEYDAAADTEEEQ